MVQMRKILLCSISLESHIKWFSVMVLMCKMIISPWAFSIFSKFWFGGLLGCVKEQKIAQNDKTFCLLCSISQEPYIMWLSFVVHKCKMISPGIFYITFSKFWFGLLWGSKGEKWPKMLKKPVLGTIHHISWFMVHMCKRTIPPGVFCIFSNFNFWGQ